MKRCSGCKIEKELLEFSRNKSRKDGLKNECKKCCRDYTQSEAGKAAHKRANQKYFQTSAGKIARQKGDQKHHKLYPERAKAHRIVRTAIRKGILIRPSNCESCSENGFIESHHEDYSKPLDVNWLCTKCHAKLRKERSV